MMIMATFRDVHGLFAAVALLLCILRASSWTFIPPVSLKRIQRTRISARRHPIVDVEFEPVNPSAAEEGPVRDKIDKDIKAKTLIDLSLEADSDFRNSRIPFIDYSSKNDDDVGMNYVDVKLAFIAELDGVKYGIGVPFDAAAAITLEKQDGSVEYISPDDDENEELMQIMAAQLKEHVGQDLDLLWTPRVLTISGPLQNYTENWKEKLTPPPIDAKALMDDSDEDLDYFLNFMRSELGEEEYEKTMNETPDENELTEELLGLFEVPGIGDRADDKEGIEELMESLLTPEEDFEHAKETLGLNSLEHEGSALKLISYIFAERKGRSYSLVTFLKPYVLVGKLVDDGSDLRFELLSATEEKLILPRLEEECRQDLEKAGLTLTSDST